MEVSNFIAKNRIFINTKSWVWKPYVLFLRWRLFRKGKSLGFSMPPNCFGPGLSIAHCGTIVVNSAVRVGENCRIHVCVNIGTEAGFSDRCPILGDNIYIGPGANAVVNKSFQEKNISIAGVPAKKISGRGSKGLLRGGGLKNEQGSLD